MSKGRKRAAHKHIAIMRYGGACVCCGESGTVFLTLDHVQGGGSEELRTMSGAQQKRGGFWKAACREGFPPRFQLMCMNCNTAKASGSECPHQTRARVLTELLRTEAAA
jgi:hypothetical protein